MSIKNFGKSSRGRTQGLISKTLVDFQCKIQTALNKLRISHCLTENLCYQNIPRKHGNCAADDKSIKSSSFYLRDRLKFRRWHVTRLRTHCRNYVIAGCLCWIKTTVCKHRRQDARRCFIVYSMAWKQWTNGSWTKRLSSGTACRRVLYYTVIAMNSWENYQQHITPIHPSVCLWCLS